MNRFSGTSGVLWMMGLGSIVSSLTSFAHAAHPGEVVQLRSYHTHSRLMIQIDQSVLVEWKKSASGFQVFLKGTTLNDLGAPMGDEERWKSLYKGLSDARVDRIDFQEKDGGVWVSGHWRFPSGVLELANPEMEVFEYREKAPPRYVVDFWIKKGPTKIEAEANLRHRQHLEALKKTREDAQKRIERRTATEKRRAETANASRFCDKPLTEENDVFVEFQPVHTRYNFTKWLPNTAPDHQFHYFKPKSNEKDAQYVRLALSLYAKGSLGLAIRTLDFLDSEFRKSEYRLQMTFLRANLLIKLGHREAGETLLRQLIRDQKESPVALHSVMYLAGRQMEDKIYSQALQSFFWLIQNYPNHDSAWLFHLGAAECLYSLREADRAAKEYRWVIENAPTDEFKAEAAFRMGDIYQLRFQYEQSLAAYFQGLNYFPTLAKNFPGFHLNRAESLYQLQQFDRAEEAFNKFLEGFPSHPQGWRATFRLGEIIGRRAKTSEGDAQARKWNYETINRYPFSPGATLARIRLLPCGDHGGFPLEAAERFFDEAKNFDGSGEVLMKNYQDLRALAHVRTLITMGSHDQTALSAIRELQTVKMGFVRRTLSSIANDFFQKMIMRLLEEEKSYEALSYYTSVAPIIPPAETVTDIDYLLKLSQAASELGLGTFAKKLSDNYDQQMNRNKQIAGYSNRNPSMSKQIVMDLDEFETQLRTSEKSFTEAKALWISSRMPADGKSKKVKGSEPVSRAEELSEIYGNIRVLLKNVKDESAYSFEKEVILALIDQTEGKDESAMKHLTRAQMLNRSLRIQAWLAQLQRQFGDLQTALDLNRDLEKRLALRLSAKDSDPASEVEIDRIENPLGLPSLPALGEVLRAEAEILEKQKDWESVAAVYERAFSYGLKQPSLQYAYARALGNIGTAESQLRAAAALDQLARLEAKVEPVPAVENGEPIAATPAPLVPSLDPNEKFWKRMASETLADARSTGTFLDAKEGGK